LYFYQGGGVDGTNKPRRDAEKIPENPTFLPEAYGNSANFSSFHAHPISRQYLIKNLHIASSSLDGVETSIRGEATTVTMDEVMAECIVSNVVPTKLLYGPT
jgi:hypothetical protein